MHTNRGTIRYVSGAARRTRQIRLIASRQASVANMKKQSEGSYPLIASTKRCTAHIVPAEMPGPPLEERG